MNCPGSVCNDAMTQLYMAWGLQPMSNNNPVFDTAFYALLFRIGSFLFGTDNGGVALNTFVQLLLFSFSFAHFTEIVFELTHSKTKTAFLICFYMINPIFGGAVQIMLKDSLHLSVFILYISYLLKLQKGAYLEKA